MTERFRFRDALTYGIRTLFWRPVRAVAYIAAISLLTYGYYLWGQSGAGMGFLGGYMESAVNLAQGDAGSYWGYFAILMAAMWLFSCAIIAGAYRVYVRDEPVLRLPLQLGYDELRTLGVYLLIALILMGIMLLAMIPMGILMMIVVFLAGLTGMDFAGADQGQSVILGGAIGVLVFIPLMLFYFYATGRVMVGLALTIRDRKFRLGGWKASKGAGMQLLWAHIVLYIAMIAAMLALMPGMMESMTTIMSDPAAAQDPAQMAALMADPYGGMAWLAIPAYALMTFLMFGPTAAVANWDARKRTAAEAPALAPAPAPAVEPAAGVGTGEVSA